MRNENILQNMIHEQLDWQKNGQSCMQYVCQYHIDGCIITQNELENKKFRLWSQEKNSRV